MARLYSYLSEDHLCPAVALKTQVLGGATGVGTVNVETPFFAARALNAATPVSAPCQEAAVPVNSLHPDSSVLIIALVGGMSMPF